MKKKVAEFSQGAVYAILDKNPFLDEERKSAISIQVRGRIEKVIDRQSILKNDKGISKIKIFKEDEGM